MQVWKWLVVASVVACSGGKPDAREVRSIQPRDAAVADAPIDAADERAAETVPPPTEPLKVKPVEGRIIGAKVVGAATVLQAAKGQRDGILKQWRAELVREGKVVAPLEVIEVRSTYSSVRLTATLTIERNHVVRFSPQ